MKIEETRREPFHETHREIIFPDKKCKGDAFGEKRKTLKKKD